MAERPTESRHACSPGLHAAAARDVLSWVLQAQVQAVQAIGPELGAIEAAADAAAAALRAGGKMAYAGAGSSGLMAIADCLELAGTFGIAPERTPMLFAGGTAALLHLTGAAEDDPALAAADLDQAGLRPGDVILCVSASGSTPYTLAIARRAKGLGVTVVGLANVPGSPLLGLADLPILLDSGPEVISGSTRMGAASAQKVALNMLSVLVGIRLGHVHDGYMVNVAADNAKLVDRAARIVAAISGRGPEAARVALAQTGGAVKPAILIARGVAPDRARAALDASGGHLAPVLAQLQTDVDKLGH